MDRETEIQLARWADRLPAADVNVIRKLVECAHSSGYNEGYRDAQRDQQKEHTHNLLMDSEGADD